MRIHRDLLESVYETAMAGKPSGMGCVVERRKPIAVAFEGMRFEAAFRIDLLVDQRLLVGVKSVERLTGAHAKQLLTYLNFGGETLEEGVHRIVNNHQPSASPRLRVNQ